MFDVVLFAFGSALLWFNSIRLFKAGEAFNEVAAQLAVYGPMGSGKARALDEGSDYESTVRMP